MSATRYPRWTAAALAGALLLLAPAHSGQRDATQRIGGYRAAADLEPAPLTSPYLPPPPHPDDDAFSVAELRAAATSSGHSDYVDLGRFHALRREHVVP